MRINTSGALPPPLRLPDDIAVPPSPRDNRRVAAKPTWTTTAAAAPQPRLAFYKDTWLTNFAQRVWSQITRPDCTGVLVPLLIPASVVAVVIPEAMQLLGAPVVAPEVFLAALGVVVLVGGGMLLRQDRAQRHRAFEEAVRMRNGGRHV